MKQRRFLPAPPPAHLGVLGTGAVATVLTLAVTIGGVWFVLKKIHKR